MSFVSSPSDILGGAWPKIYLAYFEGQCRMLFYITIYADAFGGIAKVWGNPLPLLRTVPMNYPSSVYL